MAKDSNSNIQKQFSAHKVQTKEIHLACMK